MNAGEDLMERMSKGRLFQTVGSMKEKDLPPSLLFAVT